MPVSIIIIIIIIIVYIVCVTNLQRIQEISMQFAVSPRTHCYYSLLIQIKPNK